MKIYEVSEFQFTEEFINLVNEAMRGVDDSIIALRAMKLQIPLKFRSYQGTLYRGTILEKKILDQVLAGLTLRISSITSWTKDYKFARDMAGDVYDNKSYNQEGLVSVIYASHAFPQFEILDIDALFHDQKWLDAIKIVLDNPYASTEGGLERGNSEREVIIQWHSLTEKILYEYFDSNENEWIRNINWQESPI